MKTAADITCFGTANQTKPHYEIIALARFIGVACWFMDSGDEVFIHVEAEEKLLMCLTIALMTEMPGCSFRTASCQLSHHHNDRPSNGIARTVSYQLPAEAYH